MKSYDRSYFDRWYRDPRSRIRTAADVARKVRMVLGIAEHVLDRPVRSVLDVGCGEAPWRPILRRLRPGARYTGVDASAYVVRRFGARRNIRLGTFGRLEAADLENRYDLIVCCDVLHYVPTADARRGLAFLADRVEGVAFIEAYTSADDIEGDTHGFLRRSPAAYRRLLGEARLAPVGLQCYVPVDLAEALTALEWPASRG